MLFPGQHRQPRLTVNNPVLVRRHQPTPRVERPEPHLDLPAPRGNAEHRRPADRAEVTRVRHRRPAGRLALDGHVPIAPDGNDGKGSSTLPAADRAVADGDPEKLASGGNPDRAAVAAG
jgi:hypothetical protein